MNRSFFSFLIGLFLIISLLNFPSSSKAQIISTNNNLDVHQQDKKSIESLRDLDYQTWQVVVYKREFNNKLKTVLRIVGYPGSLRIDHPSSLAIKIGAKRVLAEDITLSSEELINDPREAAVEFDLDEILDLMTKNQPMRLSLNDLFTDLPIPPYLVGEWRDIENS